MLAVVSGEVGLAFVKVVLVVWCVQGGAAG